MKIKSGATGEMVEARVGVVVKYILPVPASVKTIYTITDFDSPFVYAKDGAEIHADNLVLLHAPFMAGDEVEIWHPAYGLTQKTGATWNSDVNDFIADNELLVRHANPSLRDAPEYQP